MTDPVVTIDRAWIERHIPHQGLMCLLDRVEHWDEQEIICIATSHVRTDNPLRCNDRLGITTAIEYAAQAAAVHSALLMAGGKLSEGFLTSVRNVQWHSQHIDQAGDTLTVRATRLSGNDMTVLYAFVICAGTQSIIDGRFGIFLNSAAAQPLSAGLERLSS